LTPEANPFEPEETPEQRLARVNRMIRENYEERRGTSLAIAKAKARIRLREGATLCELVAMFLRDLESDPMTAGVNACVAELGIMRAAAGDQGGVVAWYEGFR
jgi:hypothetical protein